MKLMTSIQNQTRRLLATAGLLLLAAISATAQNGIWTTNLNGNASGSWATNANWSGGIIAGGTDNTANFATLNVTNITSTVTLDGNVGADTTFGFVVVNPS
jgi:hypothetical protein